MKKLIIPCATAVLWMVALYHPLYKTYSLKGLWEYQGGAYNGKRESAPAGYKLQRKYDATHFDALLIEPDTTPQRFQSGSYRLTADSCMETETYSAIPSKLTGKTIHYGYTLRHDSLIFKGTLPSGMRVEECWKKVK